MTSDFARAAAALSAARVTTNRDCAASIAIAGRRLNSRRTRRRRGRPAGASRRASGPGGAPPRPTRSGAPDRSGRAPPKPPLGDALRYLDQQWIALQRDTTDERLLITMTLKHQARSAAWRPPLQSARAPGAPCGPPGCPSARRRRAAGGGTRRRRTHATKRPGVHGAPGGAQRQPAVDADGADQRQIVAPVPRPRFDQFGARAAATRASAPSRDSRRIHRERPTAADLSVRPTAGRRGVRPGRSHDPVPPAAIVFFEDISAALQRPQDARAMDARRRPDGPVVRPRQFVRRPVGSLGDQADAAPAGRPASASRRPSRTAPRRPGPGRAGPSAPACSVQSSKRVGHLGIRLGGRLVRAHGSLPQGDRIRIRHARNRSQFDHQLK